MTKLILIFALLIASTLTFRPAAHGFGGELGGSLSASLGSTTSAQISTTLAIATVVATTYYVWTFFQTRRAYEHGADEARAALSEGNARPISTAPAGSALRLVAEIEREMIRREGGPRAGEITLARRVIRHADQFATLP